MKDDSVLGLALVLVVVICLGIIGLVAGDDAQRTRQTQELRSFNELKPPVILIGEDSRNNQVMLKSQSGVLILSNTDLAEMLRKSYAVGDTILKP